MNMGPNIRILVVFCLIVSAYSHLFAQTNTVDSLNEATSRISDGYSNIPYDTIPSKYITSAIARVLGTSLEKKFVLNTGNALFGRLPGLHVAQGDAEPGSDVPQFYLRGINSFGSGSISPLIIIDGFITSGTTSRSNPLMQMTPEEIEDITVLKDAAATAMFGMRAANGAILVTTKKGINGLQIGFTTKRGINHAQYIPKFAKSYEYAVLYNEALKNDGVAIPKYSNEDIEKYRSGSDPYFHPNVDWYNEVLRNTAPVSSYNLTLKGGGFFIKYFAVLNAINSQGLIKKFGQIDNESSDSKYSKYNFRTNVDVDITKRLSAQFKLGGAVERMINPYNYSVSQIFSLLATLPSNSFPIYNPNGSWGGTALYDNPKALLLKTGFYQSNSRTILSSLKITEQLDFITKGLSLSGAVSINNYFLSGSSKFRGYERFSISLSSSGDTIYSPPIGLQTQMSGDETTLDQSRSIIGQLFLNYKKSIGNSKIHAIAITETDNVVLYGPATNPSAPTAASTDPYKHNNSALRINYVYNDKYIVEGTAAYTGSNLFPEGNNYGFFPAGSVGWIISNEKFLKKNRIISFLKVRASFGLTGNDIINPLGVSRYSYLPIFYSPGHYFGTSNTISPGYHMVSLPVQDITWEKEEQLNIGLDVGLFKNLDISVNYFDRNRHDIIVPARGIVPQFVGILTPELNAGKANNRGFDVMISYHSDNTKLFKYFLEGNLSYYKTKILFNAEGFEINPNLYTTGLGIGQYLGLKSIGFYSDEDIEKRATDPKSVPGGLTETIRAGDIKYADIGGPEGKPDGIIDTYDRRSIGRPALPNISGGLHGGLQFKRFDLDFVLQGSGGNSIYLAGNYFWAFQDNGQIPEMALGRWTPETSEIATYPRLSAKQNRNNFQLSDFWLRDGDFIKLRSIELGYTIPGSIFRKMNINFFRFFFNGTNLFSWDKIPWGDPENLSGYPVMRTITGGVKIQF